MKLSEHDKWIIEQYEQDEEMMVLIFAQWCVNNEMNAVNLYEEAYPDQPKNKLLINSTENTVPKEESADITTDVLLQVLQNFGNDDLAFVVQEKIEQSKKTRK